MPRPSRLSEELQVAKEACKAAGAAIRAHYDAAIPIAASAKADDSPLTRADLDANDLILELLHQRFPQDAILSEECEDSTARLGHSRVWVVDPLDGTRDFVARTGDFAVHVGLAIDGVATLGVVYQPVGNRLFAAVLGGGATVEDNIGSRPIAVSHVVDLNRARVGISRLAQSENLSAFLEDSGLAQRTSPVGASIKMMAVALGDAELSICLHAGEKQWDTCAPEVIITEAGGRITDVDGAPFVYNHPTLAHERGIVVSNGHLHDAVCSMAQPYVLGALGTVRPPLPPRKPT